MRNRLLVLGASRYQLDVIEASQRLGIECVVVDNEPTNPGHQVADISHIVSTIDEKGVLEVAHREQVSGIIAPCTDIAVPVAAMVAETFGFRTAVSYDHARMLTDKRLFRDWLIANNYGCPRVIYAQNVSDIDSITSNNHQWVIKPDRSSGSKGVFKCENLAEVKSRFSESKHYALGGWVVVEQHIEGHNGTIEGVVKNGELVCHFFLDRQIQLPPFLVTVGHHFPSRLDSDVKEEITAALMSLLGKIDMKDGVFDCDFVWSNGELYFLEVTPRLGGNCINTLIQHATNVSLADIAVRLSLDMPLPSIELCPPSPTAVRLLGNLAQGVLAYNPENLIKLSQRADVVSAILDCAPGMNVEPFIDGRHRIGELIYTAPSVESLEYVGKFLESEIGYSIHESNN